VKDVETIFADFSRHGISEKMLLEMMSHNSIADINGIELLYLNKWFDLLIENNSNFLEVYKSTIQWRDKNGKK